MNEWIIITKLLWNRIHKYLRYNNFVGQQMKKIALYIFRAWKKFSWLQNAQTKAPEPPRIYKHVETFGVIRTKKIYRIANSSDANFPLGSWNFGFLVFFLQIINRQIKKQCNISCQFRRTDYWFADTESTSYFNSIIKHKTVRKTAWQLSLMHTFKCDRNGRLSEGT